MRALDDIRVLDLTHVFNGPYAAQVLGLLGAEVIKIEPRPYGERARSIFPIPDAEKQSYPFVMLNSNKKGITLNLKSERGKELFQTVRDSRPILWSRTLPPGPWTSWGWAIRT